MKASLILAAAGLAAASPIAKRDINDGQILNYALTLEHLEDTFYRQGLAMYDAGAFKAAGFDWTVRNNIERIAADEAEHVKFLTAALSAAGVTPVAECTYNFGYKDVKSFVATASILEGVGVSAYLGAAASIMNKAYLTAAGSILTVEARHSSYIRSSIHQVPFPQPFDDPLSFDEVYSLAAQFIVSCPSSNPALPVKAFPVLTASSSDKWIKAGSTVTLTTKAQASGTVYAAFITVTGPIWVTATPVQGGYTIVIPDGVDGQSYVVLTSDNTAVTDDNTIAGPAIVEIASPKV